MSWTSATLGEVFDIARGGSPRPIKAYISDAPDAINWISIKDASDSSKYIRKTRQKIKKEGLSRSRLVKPGDFLLTNSMSFGRPYIMQTTGCIHDGWLVLSPRDSNQVDPDYFFHLLKSDLIYRRFSKLAAGAVVKNLNIGLVSGVEVPFPPLAEQKRIAAILDKADEIRRKRQEALALTEQLLRSAFLDMFGDPVTNPKGWPLARFEDVGTLDRGRSRHRPRNDPALLGGPYPLIQTGEVSNCDGEIRDYSSTYSELGLEQSRMWPARTLCITIAANIAKTGILTFEACFPDSVVGFHPGDDVTTEFIQQWLSFLQPTLEAQAPQSAQKNINLRILRALQLPVPPVLLQRRYSGFVQQYRVHRARMATHKEEMSFLQGSLTQRAFRGEL